MPTPLHTHERYAIIVASLREKNEPTVGERIKRRQKGNEP